jgi:tRNA-2-methylthio-N6-dimethylallyladenosine synthase
MNRHYDREDYLALIDRIRRKVPGAAFTTDLIVGFPGETERDFEDTLSLVREVGFASSFTFAYSPRTGTPASNSPGQLSAEVKQERLVQLIEVQNEVSLQGNRAEIGRDVAVLVEGEAEKAPGLGAGRSRTNKLVVFSAETLGDGGASGRMADGTRPGVVEVSDLVGREVTVRVERATTWSLEGRASL